MTWHRVIRYFKYAKDDMVKILAEKGERQQRGYEEQLMELEKMEMEAKVKVKAKAKEKAKKKEIEMAKKKEMEKQKQKIKARSIPVQQQNNDDDDYDNMGGNMEFKTKKTSKSKQSSSQHEKHFMMLNDSKLKSGRQDSILGRDIALTSMKRNSISSNSARSMISRLSPMDPMDSMDSPTEIDDNDDEHGHDDDDDDDAAMGTSPGIGYKRPGHDPSAFLSPAEIRKSLMEARKQAQIQTKTQSEVILSVNSASDSNSDSDSDSDSESESHSKSHMDSDSESHMDEPLSSSSSSEEEDNMNTNANTNMNMRRNNLPKSRYDSSAFLLSVGDTPPSTKQLKHNYSQTFLSTTYETEDNKRHTAIMLSSTSSNSSSNSNSNSSSSSSKAPVQIYTYGTGFSGDENISNHKDLSSILYVCPNGFDLNNPNMLDITASISSPADKKLYLDLSSWDPTYVSEHEDTNDSGSSAVTPESRNDGRNVNGNNRNEEVWNFKLRQKEKTKMDKNSGTWQVEVDLPVECKSFIGASAVSYEGMDTKNTNSNGNSNSHRPNDGNAGRMCQKCGRNLLALCEFRIKR